MLAGIKSVLQAWHVNRAVMYAIAARAWQFIAGPITLLLIASRFSGELQGWYYTLGSLLTLQQLCELGLPNTLLHVASHSWARLQRGQDGSVCGDPTALGELASILAGGRRWFATIAIIFVGLAIGPGYIFLASEPTTINWQGPWCLAVTLASSSLILAVDFAVLEGCGQVAAIHHMRLVQAIVSNVVVWIGLIAGLQLWVIPLYTSVRLLMEYAFSRFLYRRFWSSLPPSTHRDETLWRDIVWPLQWRAAIHGVMTYLAYQLFVPILFQTDGPEVAGRFGMTWSVLTTLQSAAATWMQTRASHFGVLIRQGRYEQLDTDYDRVLRSSTTLLAIALGLVAVGILALTFATNRLGPPVDHVRDFTWLVARIHNRLLDFWTTLWLCLGVLVLHIPLCQTIYLRSHLRDPLLRPAMLVNGTMFLTTLFAAYRFGTTGMSVAYLSVSGSLILPLWTLLWRRYRLEWRSVPLAATYDGEPASP